MNRRDLITLISCVVVAWPLAASGQQDGRIRRIGVLIGVKDDAEGQARLAAFRKGMSDLGWSERRNIVMDVRFTDGLADRAQMYAAELVKSAPDAILGNTAYVVAALKKQTTTIPIVFAQVVDPVGSGLVDSLARPGGNITGFVSLDFEMGAKWLDTLKQIAPQVTRIGVLRDSGVPSGIGMLGAIQASASSFAVESKPLDARNAATIERELSKFARQPNGGLIVLSGPATTVNHQLITAVAARLRLPAVYPYPLLCEGRRLSFLRHR